MVEYRSRRKKTNKRKNTNKYNKRYNLKGGGDDIPTPPLTPNPPHPPPLPPRAGEQSSPVEVQPSYFEIPKNSDGKRIGVIPRPQADGVEAIANFDNFYGFLSHPKIASVIFGRHMFSCANAGQKYPGKALNALRWAHDPLSTFSGFVRSNIAGQILKNTEGINIKYVFSSVLFRAYYTALLLCNQMDIQEKVPFNIIPYINEKGIKKLLAKNPKKIHSYSDNNVDPTLWSDVGDGWQNKTAEKIKNRLKKIDRLLEKRLLSFVGQEDSLGDGSFDVLDKLDFKVDPLEQIHSPNFDQEPDFKKAIEYLRKCFNIDLVDESLQAVNPLADSSPTDPPNTPPPSASPFIVVNPAAPGSEGGGWSGGANTSPSLPSENAGDVLIISHSKFIRKNLLHKITQHDGYISNEKPLNNSLWKFSVDLQIPDKIQVEQIVVGFDYKGHISDETDLNFCKNYNNQGSRSKLDDMRDI